MDEAKQFLKCCLENDTVMRHDYLEMAQFCYVYLGGILPHKRMPFKLQAASAYNHARWMSKVLYVMKLAMLKPYFVTDTDSIDSLAVFCSVYYAQAWLTCTSASKAPSNDLAFVNALEEIRSAKGILPYELSKIIKRAIDKI